MEPAELGSFRKYTGKAGNILPASGKKRWFLSIITIAIVLLLSIINGPAMVFAESSSLYWTDYASQPTLSGTTYTIASAAQLAWVAKQVNAGNDFAGYTIEISDGLSSIDLSAHDWEPIGYTTNGANVDRSFSGIFDGNKIPISNLKIGTFESPETKLYYVGLFGYAKKAEIKNTCITNAAVYYSQDASLSSAGSLIGYGYDSIITECSSTGTVTCGNAAAAGGLAGRLDSCVAEDSWSLCAVTVETSADPAYVTQYAGGFAGAVNNSTISGCFHTTGNVQSEKGPAHVGGLIGNAESVVGSYGCFYSGTVFIKNCYATGEVTGGAASSVGGLAGSLTNGFVTGSHASVRVTGGDTNTEGTDDTSFVGGLVGYACTLDSEGNPDLVATDCYATGEVSGTKNCFVGGLAGFSSDLTDCHAAGSVTGGNGSNVGGLAGCACDVTDCYAIGNVVSTSTGAFVDLGGLAGYVNNVTNCYATGNVKGAADCRIGGLAGQACGDIKNSYATGSVITEGEAIDAGGLAGMVDGAGNDLVNSCATGNVSIERGNAGGLASEIVGDIINCYAAGAASSAEPDRQLGGLLWAGMYGTSVSPAYWNSDANSIGVEFCQDDYDYNTGTEIKFADTSTGVPSAYMQSSAFVDELNAFAGSHAGLKVYRHGGLWLKV
ncbi:MAG TPA: GLUG motif-containing protein [Syntrophomonas sp.]|nr:GLUG motif-containing protein [Syntrophomonas sp.]